MFHKKEKWKVKIDGMNCEHCAKKVRETLLNIENIERAKVNIKEKMAIITMQGVIDKTKIAKEIENLGYIVNEIEEV